MRTPIHNVATASILGLLLAGGTIAQAMTGLPPTHKSGSVEYLSGGIGSDEAAAIQRASKQWPLTLEFAVKDKHRADFVSDVTMAVRDSNGRPVLQAESDGPFVLARLAPGSYSVDATLGGKTLHEQVVVKRGEPAKAEFLWPAGTGRTHS
ncbi:MAG: hypothetical protein ABI460_03960 [Caldimonas sp.]